MIFPRVRISELVRQRNARAEAFARSRAAMVRAIQEEARPINIIKRHPGLLMGGLASVMSLFGLSKFASNGNGASGSAGRGNLMARLISFGSGLAARKFGFLGAVALRYGLTKLLNRRRAREN